MNKISVCILVALAATCAFARPRPAPHAPRHAPRHHAPRHHHHHHRAATAVGIGAGVLGAGLIANAIYNSTRPQTVVVNPPPVVQLAPVVVQPAPVVTAPAGHYETRVQNVWVEGRYVDQVGAGGTVIRTWQPGHYEQRSTQVWVQH